jgi:putative DNA primase/helicase
MISDNNKKHILDEQDSQDFPEDVGLRFDEKGKLTVNPNVFLRYYLKSHLTVIFGESQYFRYSRKRRVWQKIKPMEIKRQLRALLHSYEPDSWNPNIERLCMTVLPLACGRAEKLKSPEGYINVENGLISLETLSLEPHDMKVFSTTQLPIAFDPKARCPEFKAFLREIFMGDKELIRLVQEIMGYILSPRVDAQKFFIFYSPGASGKSTLCDILLALAGGEENVSTIALADLNKKFARSQIFGKVLNLSTESDVSGGLDTQALKSLSAGDIIQLESKGKDPITYRASAKLVFAVNSLPYPKDRTFALVRRMVIIPFLRRFVDNPSGRHEAKIDRDIKSRLLPELAGIFSFAFTGLRRLIENDYKFSESQKVNKLVAGYIRDVNPLLDFVKTCVRAKDGERLSADHVYDSFKRWCVSNGHTRSSSLTKRRFLREFRIQLSGENIVYTERKSNGVRFFYGVEFSQSAKTSASRRGNVEEIKQGLEPDDLL